MRPLYPVNVRRCMPLATSLSSGRFSRRGFCAFLLPFVAALTISLGAQRDSEAYAANPSKPVITEFSVMFDGIDQYWISGRVTGCDDVGGLHVEFGDMAGGHSTETGPDGGFGYLVIVSGPHTGTFSARATSHDNVVSPWAVYYSY